MKQGSSSYTVADMKREPHSRAVNPAGVAQIGSAMGNHATDVTENLHGSSEALYSGRGFEAPHDAGRTVHHGGSQGKR